MAFYERDDVILRDDPNEGVSPGSLERWSHPKQAWVTYGYLLQQVDPTTYREIDDAKVEALISAGPTWPRQPDSILR